MTRRPFQRGEADGLPADLEPTMADLERYGADSATEPSRGFADRVMEVVEAEPIPRRGMLAWLATTFASERGRVALLAATVAVAILAVVATGELARLLPGQFGGSPQPSQSLPASPEPSPTVSPTAPASVPASRSAAPSPSASDDDSGSPDASDDADESPLATDDNSGPGGGDNGGGNSGPGGGSSSPEAEG